MSPEGALFAAAPVAMAVTDAGGKVLNVNPAWERLTGRPRAEVLGRPLAELESADVIAAQASLPGERRIHVWTDARPLRELEETNRELESYNYSLSHDLRQPIAAIAGFADLLLEQTDPDLGSLTITCAREIEACAARMNQMIESLRRLADSGRGALRLAEVDVAEQVAAVLEELSVVAPVGAVRVGALPGVRGDAVLLRQMWMNLLDNALKYSRTAAEPLVEVTGERRGGWIEYAVRDNGVGFDTRDAGRLFTAFQRLADSEGFEGHGIGLAIVQRIVRRHGGEITAESAPGKGATFRIRLPESR
jgi:signal transduction histidine kinase